MFSSDYKHCTACRRTYLEGCLVRHVCEACGSTAVERYSTNNWQLDRGGRVVPLLPGHRARLADWSAGFWRKLTRRKRVRVEGA